MKSILREQYEKEIRDRLAKRLGIKNPMQVPRLSKVCVNVGIGSYLQKLSSKDYSLVEENVKKITGQKPVVRKSRTSISNFKLRENQPVGICVTLRGDNAYNFLYKLIHIAYPRVRDFRGVERNIFDKDANCSVGFKDYTIFPEMTIPEDMRKVHGVQATIVTSSKNTDHARALLEEFGFPFKAAPVAKSKK